MTVGEETLRENHPRSRRIGKCQESMTKLRQRRWNEHRQELTIRQNHSRSLQKGQRQDLTKNLRQRRWKGQR